MSAFFALHRFSSSFSREIILMKKTKLKVITFYCFRTTSLGKDCNFDKQEFIQEKFKKKYKCM